MGAQQDLEDSNEVIEGWVSHTPILNVLGLHASVDVTC